jgi:PAS domain S-box-containing protein
MKPKTLIQAVQKVQLLTLLIFSIFILLFMGIFMWNKSLATVKNQLLILTKSLDAIILRHGAEIFSVRNSSAEKIKNTLETSFRRLIGFYPPEYSGGFYSRTFHQVSVGVSNQKTNDIVPHSGDVDPSVWKTRRFHYGIQWSKTHPTWLLECDYPVIFNGQVVGYTFANITLTHLLITYMELGLTFLFIFAVGSYLSFISSQRISRNIKRNAEQLLTLGSGSQFDYIEFQKIAAEWGLNQGELAASRQKTDTILASITDAIIILDREWRLTYVNKEAEQFLQWPSQADILGKNIWDILPGAMSSKIYYEYHRAMTEQIPVHFETIAPHEDGWLDVSVYPFREGITIYLRDITARKRMENELQKSRKRIINILDAITDGFYSLDQKWRFTYINQAAALSLGQEPDILFGQNIWEFFPWMVGGTIYRGFHQAMEQKIPLHFEIRGFYQDYTWFEFHCHPWDEGLSVYLRDITEKKRIEETLAAERESKFKLEMELLKTEKLESLGILAGGIAHDFNNILAAILANLQLAKLKYRKNESIEKYLDESINTTHRASDLTKQLLTFSKGGAPIKKTASLSEIICDTAKFALRGSKVKVELIIPEPLRPVEVDSGQISQVIHNLIINANQAMPKGGIIKIISENITIEPGNRFKSGAYIRITVKDQGTGIPRENLTKIFDPYFTTKKEGTGLGLTTSYSIVRRHEGYIEVESETGRGTTFFLYLPALAEAPPIGETRPAMTVGGEKLKILLMDDEEAIVKAVSEMLEYYGYQVIPARDGAQAIHLYQQALESGVPFDAVIMDLTIPGGMGGQEAIQILREIDPRIKAIVSSGYANDPIMADYERYGFSGVVSKPYKFDELYEVIHRIIDRKQLSLDLEINE